MCGVIALAGCGGDDGTTSADRDDQPTPGTEVLGENETAPTPTAVAVATPAPTTAPVSGQTYVVQPGDLLSNIAANFGVTVDAIVEANGLENANVIFPGQELVIP